MKNIFSIIFGAIFGLFLVSNVFAVEIPVHIEWDTPTLNVDNTPLMDLSHYVVYICDKEIPTNDVDNDNVVDGPVICPDGTLQNIEVSKDAVNYTTTHNTQTTEGKVNIRVSVVDTSENESILSNQLVIPYDSLAPMSVIIKLVTP